MNRAVWCILGVLGAGAGLAGAQDEERFREVEAGVEDVGSGAVSDLLRPVDLREPTNFERVYEIVGTDLFARRAGAVTAVFDRSLYTGYGTPVVPPGTVFYLGSLPVDLGRPGLFSADREWVSAMPAGRVDTWAGLTATDENASAPRAAERVDLRVGRGADVVGPPRTETGLSIWTDEAFRQRRVGEILRGAAWRARELEAARAAESR